MPVLVIALCLMIGFALHSSALTAGVNFSANDVLTGVLVQPNRCDEPGFVKVDGGSKAECLRFYAGMSQTARLDPIIFFEGDVVQYGSSGADGKIKWDVAGFYTQLSPAIMQAEAEQIFASTNRLFVNLARPGTYGSTGDHLQRRREREVAVINEALDSLKKRIGFSKINLAGFSGGGHLVAALMARRDDIDCAVIASGNVAVRARLREMGRSDDVTGYPDFVDPIDLIPEVVLHPPRRVIILTDPLDKVVTASSQTTYFNVLHASGIKAEQRYVTARDPNHHLLRLPAIMAAVACQTGEPSRPSK